MIDEIRKRILTPLDALIDRGIQSWRLLALLVPGGTVLFLLLFLAFGAPFGLVFVAGFLLVVMEGGIGVGIFLLDVKYRGQINERSEAADAIEAFVTQSDVFSDWDKFIASPAEDPELEEVRQFCAKVTQEFPPDGVDEPCGEAGVEALEACAAQLRGGLATKGAERFWTWFKGWRSRRSEKKSTRAPGRGRGGASPKHAQGPAAPRSAAALTREPAPRWEEVQRRKADREADTEAARADREEKRDAKRAARLAKKAVKKAVKHEKKTGRKGRTVDMPRELPLPPEQMPSLDDDDDAPDEPLVVPVHEEPAYEEPAAPRRARGLSEAGAIQMVMDAGFTAHDYDRAQHRLAAERRRQPAPSEVVKALLSRSKGGAAKTKKRRGRRRKTGAPRPSVAARPGFGPKESLIFVQRRRRHPFRVLVLLALVPGLPFAAWRIPHGDAVVIEGEVWHQALDTAPDIGHQLRTLFEEVLGNRPVSLVDGQRIYVSEADYLLCWPESWEEIYEHGYSMWVEAEARPLILGGYAVAKIARTERIDHPVAAAD